MKFGVVVFPGSNCDLDVYHLLRDVLHQPVDYIWHTQDKFAGYDCIILPGGFSFGDYLRCGAIARFSPVMQAVVSFANAGGLVLGICNGFQILLEAGLLPGALYRNTSLQFRCQQTHLKVENTDTPFTRGMDADRTLKIPIAH
ncbi:MAG: phosphoribosylformylglycinamidine synthase subunit PurQ, partial [Firmicutes bacterium]|nr:phosphoribosylformylglycinamidine synthase subunit PurQ [Bacillota bacterium]